MLIVIPAANEEKRLGATLSNLLELPHSFKVLVVNNGGDATPALVKDISNGSERVSIINFSHPIGKGRAILEGLKLSKESACFYDADGATSAMDLVKMDKKLREGYDIVIGSRFLPGSKRVIKNWKRMFLSKVFRLFIEMTLGLRFSDFLCGAKAFNAKTVKWINSQKWSTGGFEWDTELLLLARNAGLSIAEIPISWEEKPGSTLGYKSMVETGIGALKLFLFNKLNYR